jgi:hypothetical protein
MIHWYYDQPTTVRFDINWHLFYEFPINSWFDTKIVLALWIEIRAEHMWHISTVSVAAGISSLRVVFLRKMDLEGTEFNLWRHLNLYFPIVFIQMWAMEVGRNVCTGVSCSSSLWCPHLPQLAGYHHQTWVCVLLWTWSPSALLIWFAGV